MNTDDLTVLKMLAKRKTVPFVAAAVGMTTHQVLAVAEQHGATRPDGSLDLVAAEKAAAWAEQAAAPGIPTREPAEDEPAPVPIRPRPAGGKRRPLGGLCLIDVTLIDNDGRNVRDELGDLTELARSIRQVGILQPLGVVPHRTGRYLIEWGHRRLGAALIAGLTEVPCIVRPARDDTTMRIERLIENLHRKDLAPIEEATAYRLLMQQGLTQSEIARRVGVSSATVSMRLALLELPADAQEMVRDGRLPLTEAMRLGAQVRAKGAGAVNHPAQQAPDYWATHPLIREAKDRCSHWGRRQYGRAACGECIEAVIRADEGLRLLTSPTRRDTSA